MVEGKNVNTLKAEAAVLPRNKPRIKPEPAVGKGKGFLLNIDGQTGKDCLLTWADGVKVADSRD